MGNLKAKGSHKTSENTVKTKKNRVTYKVTNVVTSVTLGVDVNLDIIAKKFKDVNFNLNRFPGLSIKMLKPKCVILLFKNGKMVITGLKQASDVPIVLSKIRNRLKVIPIDIPENPDYRVVNLVVSADFGVGINLDLSMMALEKAIYEPEVFPGLIFRMEKPVKCVILAFSSGKFVITGLKSESEISKVIVAFGKEIREKELFTPTDPIND